MKSEDISQRDIIITKPTIDILRSEKRFLELVGLYTFYYYTAVWQKTNQPYATTGYTAKGCYISEAKIRILKKILIRLGFIEDVVVKDEQGQITGHFIKVRFYRNHPYDFPRGGLSQGVENRKANAYRDNRLNAYRDNTVARKRDDYNLNPSFGISQSNNGQNQFDINCTNRLIKILQAKRKIMRKVNTNSWIRQFKKLRVDDEVEKRKIKNVLIWYGQHIGEKYMIEAYSAKTFRDRFDKIANKMNQSQDPKRKKDYEPGDPEDDFKTTTTRWVTKDGKKRSRVVIDES